MIIKARRVSDNADVLPCDADPAPQKGDYICPYCDIPLVPVDGKFWRLYPGDQHGLGYCKTMANQEGRVYNPAYTKEARFFLNDSRPEKGYRIGGESIFDLGDDDDEIEIGSMEGNDTEGLEEGMEGVENFGGVDLLDTVSAGGLGLMGAEGGIIERDKPEFSRESSASELKHLYDMDFHKSRLDEPMFAGKRKDYMVLADNAAQYLREHDNRISGFKILELKYTGYSFKDRTLLFNIYRNEWHPGERWPRPVLFARAEMSCLDEDYFMDVLFHIFNEKTPDSTGRYPWKYAAAFVWARGNWKWTPKPRCSGCKYLKTHTKETDCGTCMGIASARINTSRALLLVRWKTNEGQWMTRKDKTLSLRRAKAENEAENREKAEIEAETVVHELTKEVEMDLDDKSLSKEVYELTEKKMDQEKAETGPEEEDDDDDAGHDNLSAERQPDDPETV